MARKPTKPAPDPLSPRLASSLPRIALFKGEEAFLRHEYTSQLRSQLSNAHGEVEVFTFDGASAQASDVLDECRSFGLMAGHKLIIVDDADDMVSGPARALFERYAQSPSDNATLVLRTRTWHAGKLDKLIEAVGTIRECKAPSEQDAAGWVMQRAAKPHKASITLDAARALVERVGASYMQLDSELGKLAAAAGSNASGAPNAITPALVAAFVGISREEQVWGVQKTVLSGSTQASLQHLRHVLDVSRQPSTLMMFAMMDLARKLHGTSAGLRGGAQPFALTKTFRLWGDSQQAFLSTARQLSPSCTLEFLEAAVSAGRRTRTGLGDEERALEALVVRAGLMLAQPQPRGER